MDSMPSPVVVSETRPTLKDGVRLGIRYAALLSVLVLATFAVAIPMVAAFRPSELSGVVDVLVMLPLVFAAYFMGGVLGGAALWVLRPLRRWVVGWVATGVLIAGAAYGSVGLVAAVAYVYGGINMMDYTSPADAWSSLLPVTLMTSLGAGIPGGLLFWWKERD